MLRVIIGTNPNNRWYYRPLASNEPFVHLLDEADANYRFIGNAGPHFFFLTTLHAPHGRVISIDIRSPDREHWGEVIAEQEDIIDGVSMVNQQLVVISLPHAYHIIKLYALNGTFVREIALPTLGSIVDFSGRADDAVCFFKLSSFLSPGTIYRYDVATATLALYRQSGSDFNPDPYITEQVFYPSTDGTRIPMFLTYRRDLVRDGHNPTLLHGYGGFRNSQTPLFSLPARFWIEQGGIYAVANLRGGGEYGEEWHQAGILEKKQQVFDDFIAAAEWLIAQRYTASSRLAISGGSNGGLLVGACLVQRPDLFGAVLCRVPVIDMLRYHKWFVGHYWTGEYGNAEASKEHFRFLYAYSPLHNVRPGVNYPPILIMTAESDDRVSPAHALKFAAALQDANMGLGPVLLSVEPKVGHGTGKPTKKVIEQWTMSFTFLFHLFGMRPRVE